jgi:hypothetical protein
VLDCATVGVESHQMAHPPLDATARRRDAQQLGFVRSRHGPDAESTTQALSGFPATHAAAELVCGRDLMGPTVIAAHAAAPSVSQRPADAGTRARAGVEELSRVGAVARSGVARAGRSMGSPRNSRTRRRAASNATAIWTRAARHESWPCVHSTAGIDADSPRAPRVHQGARRSAARAIRRPLRRCDHDVRRTERHGAARSGRPFRSQPQPGASGHQHPRAPSPERSRYRHRTQHPYHVSPRAHPASFDHWTGFASGQA